MSGACFGGVEPDWVEGVEVERGIGAVQDGPCAELRGGEAQNDDPGELRVFSGYLSSAGEAAAGDGGEEECQRETRRPPRPRGCVGNV